MNATIVPQLVRKDLYLIRHVILYWWAGGIVGAALTMIVGPRFFIFGMILLLACMLGAGMHAAIMTVVEERKEKTLPFIMSLPITVREYTTAKLIANLAVFIGVWFSLFCAGLFAFVGPGILNDGAIPFATVVALGVFLAYVLVLATSLVTESHGWAVSSTVWANLGTQLFLWWVAGLPEIRSTIGGFSAVWSETALVVIGAQVGLIVVLIALTYVLQARKTDFV